MNLHAVDGDFTSPERYNKASTCQKQQQIPYRLNCRTFRVNRRQVQVSKQGQPFRSQAQSTHIETLQSLWLCELMCACSAASVIIVSGLKAERKMSFMPRGRSSSECRAFIGV